MSPKIQRHGMSLTHFIRLEEANYPEASGELTTILSDLASSSKVISQEIVERAGIDEAVGKVDTKNVHGEQQLRIDIIAHNTFINDFERNNHIVGAVSEEEPKIIVFSNSENKKYVILLDPLDGSSNFDKDVSVGTIFAVYKKVNEKSTVTEKDFLQKGENLACAGYFLYGSSTMFVYTTGNGVNGFTLDSRIGEYILTHPNMKIPEGNGYLSVNYSYRKRWDEEFRNKVEGLLDELSSRYIGSFVADLHRNLIGGGVFLYPGDLKHPKGKLRLTYEAIPMALLIRQAGGLAIDGDNNILDIEPSNIHQRVPLIIGSKNKVELFLKDPKS
ncbi:class 1 fructose-bisphosphatase [Patescibacteria group bacterium]